MNTIIAIKKTIEKIRMCDPLNDDLDALCDEAINSLDAARVELPVYLAIEYADSRIDTENDCDCDDDDGLIFETDCICVSLVQFHPCMDSLPTMNVRGKSCYYLHVKPFNRTVALWLCNLLRNAQDMHGLKNMTLDNICILHTHMLQTIGDLWKQCNGLNKLVAARKHINKSILSDIINAIN